jgi:isopentenyl-diphosphate Delta-isomerase
MDSKELLEVIDEQGRVIAVQERAVVHRLGLLHREVNIWFCTPRGELIFQHRALDKDLHPDLLDASVAGHVKVGQEFEQSALEEFQEETGLILKPGDLLPLTTYRSERMDVRTGNYNNSLRAVYLHFYEGAITNLGLKQAEGVGFETWTFERLKSVNATEKRRFVPSTFEEQWTKIFETIEKLWKERYPDHL